MSISKRRHGGYLRALNKHHLLDYQQAIECGGIDEHNREKIRALLLSEEKPDGIFAAIEKFAVNTYEVCKELEISIPSKLKVISFSNLSAAALFDPPLSTITQSSYEIGKKAADVLFKIIEKKVLLPNDKKVIIASTIVERKSTAK